MRSILLLLILLLTASCTEAEQPKAVAPELDAAVPGAAPVPPGAVAEQPAAATEQPAADGGTSTSLAQVQSKLGLKSLREPWFGDLDGMVERRVIRVLTVYGLGRYYLDGPQEKGFAYEFFKLFEDDLNKRLGSGNLKVHVLMIPVSRDQLIPGLLAGRGDIAAAGLTIMPERDAQVDFSDPVSKPLREVIVTGPTAPPLAALDDLAGQTVAVRLSSSYHASLQELNRKFAEAGRPAIQLEPMSELLEDEDLLEMANAGLLPWVVVDDFKAAMFAPLYPALVVRSDLVLREGGRIGYAFREGSPQLAAALNEFLKTHREGTMLGNVLIKRYMKDSDYLANALRKDDFKRFRELADMFKRYGEQYGMDYLLVAAQGYQESRLDQSVRSRAGAIGIMQMLPATATDPNVAVPDIHLVEDNIHAGIKYLDFIRDRYFSDPGMDRLNQTLLAIASYNAGPARIAQLRRMAEEEGYDPNRWFGNVEVIAAREIGRETVQYVSNIYKYYAAYRMAASQMAQRAAEREAQGIKRP